jgi:hypothetical protein
VKFGHDPAGALAEFYGLWHTPRGVHRSEMPFAQAEQSCSPNGINRELIGEAQFRERFSH